MTQSIPQVDSGGRTGSPPGLLQDDSRGLSKWFASQPSARHDVRRAFPDTQPLEEDCGMGAWVGAAADPEAEEAPAPKWVMPLICVLAGVFLGTLFGANHVAGWVREWLA